MVKEKIEYLLKHNSFVQLLYKIIMSNFFKFIGLFIKTDDKLILFNGQAKRYNDSAKAIYLKLLEKDTDKKFKYVWAVGNPKDWDIPYGEVIIQDSFKYFITALKAKYWVACVNIERGLHFKKKNTIFINTWHGASINLCGNAVKGRSDFDCSNVDYWCITGEYERDYIIHDFKVNNSAIQCIGLPRNDVLYKNNKEKRTALKEQLNLPANKKVILYAPTWRESKNNGSSYDFIPPISWKKWKEKLGDEYVILLRTHAYTTKMLNVKFDDFVRDYTSYPEINDLLIVSDILITDYSSLNFDYCVLNKPIYCFGYDYDNYKEERGFYFDLEKYLPNGVSRTEDELINLIVRTDYSVACEKTKRFKENFGIVGGNATESCVDFLLSK